MVTDSPTQFWREGFSAVSASFLLFNNGASIGWSSPALPSLQADADFAGRICENTAAWIGEYLLTVIFNQRWKMFKNFHGRKFCF